MNKTFEKQKPLLEGEALFGYIPQRPPFVLVDKLYEKGADYVYSGFTVTADHVLLERDCLQEGGLVENMAQTAALFAGIRATEQGQEMPLGFIAGIKNLRVQQLPQAGTELYTRITLTHDLQSVQVLEGEVWNVAEQPLASCELRIFLKEEEQ